MARAGLIEWEKLSRCAATYIYIRSACGRGGGELQKSREAMAPIYADMDGGVLAEQDMMLDMCGAAGASAASTLETTAATNTPATQDGGSVGPLAFEPGELKLAGSSRPQPAARQNGALDGSLSSGSPGTSARNYEYYKAGRTGGGWQRAAHTHTLSTPTAMSDFIAMLDAQSAAQQQWPGDDEKRGCESGSELSSGGAARLAGDSGSLSPLRAGSGQFIDPNLLSSNVFMDSFAAGGDEDALQRANLNSLLDDYVSTELLGDDATALDSSQKLAHMHSNRDAQLFTGDRRHSEVITQAVPELTAARGSISHSIDFWNLGEGDGHAPTSPALPPAFAGDSDVTQVLNDYNMNFTRTSRRNSHGAGAPAQRHGVKKQPRGSMSLLDGSLNGDLFSKLYKNGTAPGNLKLVSWDNSVFSDEDEDFGRRSIDPGLPTLEPIMSPQSPKSGVVSGSKKQQFIKPSMMLSENASTAAKVATTGTEKIDLIANLDTRNYDISIDPSVKIRRSPPPHYQTIKPSPIATINSSMSTPAVSRRRRSTPNIMTIRNGSTGAGVGGGARGKSRSITPMSGPDDEAKPFKCKECAKAFRRSEHLKRHIRSVHSTERPFACMFCEKKFSRSDNLSQHLKTHKKHGDF